jgi:hypothetical protein
VAPLARDPNGGTFLMVVGHGDFWTSCSKGRSRKESWSSGSSTGRSACTQNRARIWVREAGGNESSRYPLTDLFQVLFQTSVSPQLRATSQSAWMKHYHELLTLQLGRFGYSSDASSHLYPFSELIKDYQTGIGHGFMWGMVNAMVSIESNE